MTMNALTMPILRPGGSQELTVVILPGSPRSIEDRKDISVKLRQRAAHAFVWL